MASPTPIQKVAREAGKAFLARERMIEAIREANSAGVSLREIAVAARMSHETVRRLASPHRGQGTDAPIPETTPRSRQ